MKDRRDIFEENLRRLFAHAHAPIEPRPEFVEELERAVVAACRARANREAFGRGRSGRHAADAREASRSAVAGPWRGRLTAAAAVLLVSVGAWFAYSIAVRSADERPDRGQVLARARARTSPTGDWTPWRELAGTRSVEPGGDAYLVTGWLELRTTSAAVELQSRETESGAADRWIVAPSSSLVIDRAARAARLAAGALRLRRESEPSSRWTIDAPAVALSTTGDVELFIVGRGRLLAAATAPDDPLASWATPGAIGAIGAIGALDRVDSDDVTVALVDAIDGVDWNGADDRSRPSGSLVGRALFWDGRPIFCYERDVAALDDADRASRSDRRAAPIDGPHDLADTAEAEPDEEEMAVEHAALHGRVTDLATGAPVETFDVVLLEESNLPDPSFPMHRAFTDAEGRFAWPGVDPGRYRVQVGADGYAPWYVLGHAVGASGDDESPGLEIALDRGLTVRGRVVDADGAPIVGAEVLSEHDAAFGVLPLGIVGPIPEIGGRTLTRADGRFELSGLSTGQPEHSLRASHPERGAGWARVDSSESDSDPSSTLGEVEIVVARAGSIAGRVAADDGTAKVGSRIIASYVGHVEPCLSFGADLTDAEGRYRIDGLPPGSYALIHAGPDTSRGPEDFESVTAFVPVESGAVATHDFGNTRSLGGEVEVSGVVRRPDGSPFAFGNVSFVRVNGDVGGWERSLDGVTTSSDGTFSLELAPGRYGVFTAVDAAHDLTWIGAIEPSAEDPGATLDLVFERAGGSFAGRIVAADGTVVPEAMLTLERTDPLPAERGKATGKFIGRGIARRDGSFSLTGLQDGSYRARVIDPRGKYAIARYEFELRGPSRSVNADVQLEAGHTVALTFSDPDGQPLSGVRVRLYSDGDELELVQSMVSGAAGELDVRGLPSGTIRMTARLHGYETWRFDVTIVDEPRLEHRVVLTPR